MRYIQKGNSVHVVWTISNGGQPEDFSDKNVTVNLISKCNCKQPITYTIVDNQIIVDYYATDQVEGVHTLQLIENEGQHNQALLNFVDAFTISKTLKNRTTSGTDSCSSIKTEVIELSSNLDTGMYIETDPVFMASPAAKITDEEIEKWNTPVDLSDFPTKEEVAVELEQKQDTLQHYTERDYSAEINVKGQNNEHADLILSPNRTVLGHYGDNVKKYGEILINDNGTNVTHGEYTLSIRDNGKIYFDDKELLLDEQVNTLNWRQFDNVFNTPKKSCWTKVTKIFGPGMNNGYDGYGYTFFNKDTNEVIQLFFKTGEIKEILYRTFVYIEEGFTEQPEWIALNKSYKGTNGITVSENNEISLTQSFKTINGENIEGVGDITVQADPYDDSELRQMIADVEEQAGNAKEMSNAAEETANEALEQAGNAKEMANTANDNATEALEQAGNAKEMANTAAETAEQALEKAKSVSENLEGNYNPTDNFKTINNQSIIGVGNINIQGGGEDIDIFLTQEEFDNLAVKETGKRYNIIDAPTPITQVASINNRQETFELDKKQTLYTATINDSPIIGTAQYVNYNLVTQENYDAYNNQHFGFAITLSDNADATGEILEGKIWDQSTQSIIDNENWCGVKFRTYSDNLIQMPYLQNFIYQYFVVGSNGDGTWSENQINTTEFIVFVENIFVTPWKYNEEDNNIIESTNSGDTYNNTESKVTLSCVSNEVGNIDFTYRQFGENGCDFVKFYSDLGSTQNSDSGNNEWKENVTVFQGTPNTEYYVTLSWVKDGSVSNLPDKVQIKLDGKRIVENSGFSFNLVYTYNEYIKGDVAKRDEFATINGQVITEGGNIEIKGGEGGSSYDDTELREMIAGVDVKASNAKELANTAAESAEQAISGLANTVKLPSLGNAVSNANPTSKTGNNYIEGYYKTSTSTLNLPSGISSNSKWGILFTLYENTDQGTGTQFYYPIDGTQKGYTYTRSFTRTTELSAWVKIATQTDINTLQTLINTVSSTANESLDKVNALYENEIANLVLRGNPIIQDNTLYGKQLTGFSENDYAQFPFLVDLNSLGNVEINIVFSTFMEYGDTRQQNILDSNYGFALAVKNRRIVLAISSNGTSWDNEYEIWHSDVGNGYIMWTLNMQYNNGTLVVNINNEITTIECTPYPKQIIIGKGIQDGHYFAGSISLENSYIKSNGNYIWKGLDTSGLNTRLATDLSNLDAAGEEVIKELSGNGYITKDETGKIILANEQSQIDLAPTGINGIHMKAGVAELWLNPLGLMVIDNKTSSAYKLVGTDYVQGELSKYNQTDNFKTINGNSLIGTGNIQIGEGGSSYDDTELRELVGNAKNLAVDAWNIAAGANETASNTEELAINAKEMANSANDTAAEALETAGIAKETATNAEEIASNIKANKLTMTATLEDGTTVSFEIYGSEV